MVNGRRPIGWLLLALAMLGATCAPWLTPYTASDQFREHLLAPPMRPRVRTLDGEYRWPFVYPLTLVDPIERRFAMNPSTPTSLVLFHRGRVVAIEDDRSGPWLPLGSDSLGRDVWTRLVLGARLSLGVAGCAALGALALGVVIGGTAAMLGGRTDLVLMRLADFVLIVPWLYLVAMLRAVLPLVLPVSTVFVVLVAILAGVAWPTIARGVRAILAAELVLPYASAVVALGGTRWRLMRHTLPAAAGFAATQMVLLVPAFILAEATLSFVGWGFPSESPSWGTMLQDARHLSTLVSCPWLLAPAAAMVVVTLAIHLALEVPTTDRAPRGTATLR